MKEHIRNTWERKRFFLEESLSPNIEKALLELQTLQEDFFPSEKYKTELHQKLSSYHSFSVPQKSSLWYIWWLGISFSCILWVLLHFHFFTQESSFELPPPVAEMNMQRSVSVSDWFSQTMFIEDEVWYNEKSTSFTTESLLSENIKENKKSISSDTFPQESITHQEISSFSQTQGGDISHDSPSLPTSDTSLEWENQVFMRMNTFSHDSENDSFPQIEEEYWESMGEIYDMQEQYDVPEEDFSSRIQEFQEICEKYNGIIRGNNKSCVFDNTYICEFETLFSDSQELCPYIYHEKSGTRK